jgi:hypothetical protein
MNVMNLGSFMELERHEAVGRAMARYRQEAVERAMARYRAEKPREQRLSPARAKAGWRSITRDEAIALVGKKNPRGAFKLQMMPKPGGGR